VFSAPKLRAYILHVIWLHAYIFKAKEAPRHKIKASIDIGNRRYAAVSVNVS
jgi:hypothetical protein